MVIRNAANHTKIATMMGWCAEDVRQFIELIEQKVDGSGYFLFPHPDMHGVARLTSHIAGNRWVIETGPIDLDQY